MSALAYRRLLLRPEDVRGIVGSAYTYERIHRWRDSERGHKGYAKCGAPLRHTFDVKTASPDAIRSWHLCRKCFRTAEDLA